MRRFEHDAGVRIIGDGIEETPYTDESAWVCWHNDPSQYQHSQHKRGKGTNLVGVLCESCVMIQA